MTYQYPTRRQSPKQRQPKPAIETVRPPDEPIGLIRGRDPGSRQEWYAANALDYWKIDFRYQVPIRGGRLMRTGQVLDFLIYIPFATPMQVFGPWWHTGQLGEDDYLALAMLRQEYGRDVIILWGNELETQEQAIETIGAKVRP